MLMTPAAALQSSTAFIPSSSSTSNFYTPVGFAMVKQHQCLFIDLSQNGFHGRTMGAMALTTSKTYYRANFGPLMPGVFIAPYPYCLHCKARQASPSGNDWYTVRALFYAHLPLAVLPMLQSLACFSWRQKCVVHSGASTRFHFLHL